MKPHESGSAMLISEAARRAGVSRDTVRLYTRLGLVTCAMRPAGSRTYAEYDDATVELIQNIKWPSRSASPWPN
jgi:MerR family copper efflux transcriptional regulator